MPAPALAVEESPKARAQLGLTSGGSGWGATAINGAASAGSKHVVDASGATDVTTERVKITCPVGTYRLTLGATNGVAAHPFIVRVSIAPFDAVEADDNLKTGTGEIRRIPCDSIAEIRTDALADRAFDVYWVAVPVQGATKASIGGTFFGEAN